MMDTFLFCDCRVRQSTGVTLLARKHTEWPVLMAMSLRLENTYGTVSGFGLKRVF